MKKRQETKDSIVFNINLMTTPPTVYRRLISQKELRKWWAPRVIMSRNIVSQEDGKDVEMRLLQKEENLLVRYSWRPLDWEEQIPSTVITFKIRDLGISRQNTGQGITLEMTHDGWENLEDRRRQEEIWKMALRTLKAEIQGKTTRPWWESEKLKRGIHQIKWSALKEFLDKISGDPRSKPEKKLSTKVLTEICSELDSQGRWYMKENGNEVELHFLKQKIFGILKNGQISINWRELEKFLGASLSIFSDRLAMEQNLDIHIGKNQEKVPAYLINPTLWNQWCIDIIQILRG